MTRRIEGSLRGEGLRIAIAVSRFNSFITDRLLEGARDALARHGVNDGAVVTAYVPGAFELPVVAHRLASSGQFDAVVCLGAVIKGATDHYGYVAGQAAAGIMRAALDTGVPVIFGVLTTETTDQALERVGIKGGNKGYEAAVSAIETVILLRQLPEPTT